MTKMSKMSQSLNPALTPASKALPGREPEMGKMLSGGYAFVQTDEAKLNALLILGNEHGSYYEQAEAMATRHSELLRNMALAVPQLVIDKATEVSVNNYTLNNLYPLYALAVVIVLNKGKPAVRDEAFKAMLKVARTGSDFLGFVAFLLELGVNWGRNTKRGVASWYFNQEPTKLIYQMVKYQNRHGMTHERVFRLAHVTAQATGPIQNSLFDELTAWLKGEDVIVSDTYALIHAHKAIHSPDVTEDIAARLIRDHRLTWEMVPTHLLKSRAVWDALLQSMPYNATLRTINRMTAYGLFDDKTALTRVVDRLSDMDAAARQRVHPLSVVIAQRQYARGAGDKGSMTWSPESAIIDTLDDAFYKLINELEPVDKSVVIIVDVSGSMRRGNGPKGLAILEACSAIVSAAMHRYTSTKVIAVDTLVHDALGLSKKQRLDDMSAKLRSVGGGGTRLEKAVDHLNAKRMKADAVLFLTDGESWDGTHLSQSWAAYRRQVAPGAKQLTVQVVPSGYQLADPLDESCRTMNGFGPEVFRILDMMLDGTL